MKITRRERCLLVALRGLLDNADNGEVLAFQAVEVLDTLIRLFLGQTIKRPEKRRKKKPYTGKVDHLEGFKHTCQVTQDILGLVDKDVALSAILYWTDEERELAEKWAAREHAAACAEPGRVTRLPEPEHVKVWPPFLNHLGIKPTSRWSEERWCDACVGHPGCIKAMNPQLGPGAYVITPCPTCLKAEEKTSEDEDDRT